MAILLNMGPVVELMHLAPIHGPRAATECTGVALPTPPLNIVSSLEPVVSLLELTQGLVGTLVTS
jgi:hypothetical protein